MKKNNGASLVEVAVITAILSILMVTIASAMVSISNSQNKAYDYRKLMNIASEKIEFYMQVETITVGITIDDYDKNFWLVEDSRSAKYQIITDVSMEVMSGITTYMILITANNIQTGNVVFELEPLSIVRKVGG